MSRPKFDNRQQSGRKPERLNRRQCRASGGVMTISQEQAFSVRTPKRFSPRRDVVSAAATA
jgi:hypothetical protein